VAAAIVKAISMANGINKHGAERKAIIMPTSDIVARIGGISINWQIMQRNGMAP